MTSLPSLYLGLSSFLTLHLASRLHPRPAPTACGLRARYGMEDENEEPSEMKVRRVRGERTDLIPAHWLPLPSVSL